MTYLCIIDIIDALLEKESEVITKVFQKVVEESNRQTRKMQAKKEVNLTKNFCCKIITQKFIRDIMKGNL